MKAKNAFFLPKPLNPWFKNLFQPWFLMMIHPGRTIRQIVDGDPQYQIKLLIFIIGFINALELATRKSLEESSFFESLLVFYVAATIGPVVIWIGINIGGGIFQIVGNRLGGKANKEEVRSALVWGSIPRIFSFALFWLPIFVLFIFEKTLELTHQLQLLSKIEEIVPLLGLFQGCIRIPLMIWEIIVPLICLSEVHRFSVWKAIATCLIPGIMIALPFLLLNILVK